MRLSPNFTLAEAIASATAQRIGNDNQPTRAHLVNLRTTAAHMEAVRRILESPLVVTSWYRNPAVNAAVGGVKTSHHALGLAVDFRLSRDWSVDVGFNAAVKLERSDLEFDQLIWYRPTGIIHLSFHPAMRRRVQTNPTTNAGAKLLKGLKR